MRHTAILTLVVLACLATASAGLRAALSSGIRLTRPAAKLSGQ